MTPMAAIWVALGSAAGGVGRFWLVWTVDRHFQSDFPWGTLLVNLIGSTLIGVLAAAAVDGGRWALGDVGRQALMIGVLGGFTTFSAFSLQTLGLLQAGQVNLAFAYALLSVLLCLAGVWLGYAVAVPLFR